MNKKKWLLKEKVSITNKDKFPEVNPIILQLLFDRGLTSQEQIEEFLTPDYVQDVHDPFLLKDMSASVKRIMDAIDKKERITVFGDYDADGVCASLILVKTIEFLGGKADTFLPHREKEGYGLIPKSLDYIAGKNTALLITADCGITSAPEVEYAKSLGMDVIVTDHHDPPKEIPDCLIIHPRVEGDPYPSKYLAGGGVAFKLAQALLRTKCKANSNGELDYDCPEYAFEKWLLDLVAVSTVADMMPLVGENRTLVKFGLVVLNKARRIGMKCLLEEAGLLTPENADTLTLNTYNVGFQISPRINAAGRMDHANVAYALLFSEDEKQAKKLAKELNENNIKRQEVMETMTNQAVDKIGSVEDKEIKVLFAYNPEWMLGVAGLVANKVIQKYHLPAVIASELDGQISASVRSIPGFNFVEALTEHKEYFTKFGGHAMACGFTLKDNDKWEELQEKLNKRIAEKMTLEDVQPRLEIDAEIELSSVTWDLVEDLEKFEPFGKANPKPLFVTKNLEVHSLEAIGKDGNHLKMVFSDHQDNLRKAIGFCMGNWCQKLSIGKNVDIVYEIDVNRWNGHQELQLKLQDIKIN